MNDHMGQTSRRVIASFMDRRGQNIVAHESFNTPKATSYVVRGMKTSPSKSSSEVIFQFLDQLDMPIGTVLQVEGTRDFWRVTDTEDIVTGGVYVNFEVHVEKINPDGSPLRPRSMPGHIYNLHGANSRVNIGSQDNSTNISGEAVGSVFADMRKAIEDQITSIEARAVLLDKIEELEQAKGTKSFIDRYKEFMAVAADHIGVIGAFLPALAQLLGN